MAKIEVMPEKALVDVPLKLTVEGLVSGSRVTIRSKLVSEKGIPFYCMAHYVADDSGTVDLDRDASVGGYYKGVEPMGLIWAMKVLPGRKSRSCRLEKNDVTTPFVVEFAVFDYHVYSIEDTFEAKCVCLTTAERWYMSKNVTRIPIRENDLTATLFVPKGRGPFFGVLDLFGGKPGVTEFRASLMASHGYLTMALSYFDKKEYEKGLNMEYFEHAAKFLTNQQKVKTGGIGVIGVSLGATVALFMAAYFPQLVKCVVSINGSVYADAASFIYRGRRWNRKFLDFRKVVIRDSAWYGRDAAPDITIDNVGDAMIEFHRSPAEILFVIGTDDGTARWQDNRSYAEELMKKSGKTNYEFIINHGAGHLFEPPYAPHCYRTFFIFDADNIWGGNTKDHARAQEKSWEAILIFFQRASNASGASTLKSKF